MRSLPENSYTAIVSDPPYGIEFAGSDWDKALPSKYVWKHALRVLKPGGMMLIFGGSRTFHRVAVAIEDAGFVIKDIMLWLHGMGFPHGLDMGRAIDKRFGLSGEEIEVEARYNNGKKGSFTMKKPASPEAKLWDGWNTVLKPAYEPVIIAMKPMDGSYIDNALEHGVAGLNIDATRVPSKEGDYTNRPVYVHNNNKTAVVNTNTSERIVSVPSDLGRYPANVILDEEAAKQLDEQTGDLRGTKSATKGKRGYTPSNDQGGMATHTHYGTEAYGDSGGASRFFYTAKPSKREKGKYNKHPTVKPISLMEYVLKFVIMPQGTKVLDPFSGSGTTLVAAQNLGIHCDGCELQPEYFELIQRRVNENFLRIKEEQGVKTTN